MKLSKRELLVVVLTGVIAGTAPWAGGRSRPGGLRLGAAAAQQPAPAPAEARAPRAEAGAPSKLAVRIAPSRNPGDQGRALEVFMKYFEPSRSTLDSPTPLETLSRAQCGHPDTAWIAAFRSANPGLPQGDVSPAGVELLLPACPFWRLGGALTIRQGETVGGQLLQEVGQAGSRTRARIAALNDRTPGGLDAVAPGETLALPFTAPRVAYNVRREYAFNTNEVARQLLTLPGAIRATTEVSLTLVADAGPCDASGEMNPVDADRLAGILERNTHFRAPRLTSVGVIDTGIDTTETRLFLAESRDVPNGRDDDRNGWIDDTVGANMDRRQPGFPTTAATYGLRAHGTHVAGLVLGGVRTERLTAAVRARIQLRVINLVSRDSTIGPGGAPAESFGLPLSNLMEAIAYSRRLPPLGIINMSVETETQLVSLEDVLKEGDYLLVVAAGNDGRNIDFQPVYPAGLARRFPQKVIAVAAHDARGALPSFSNRGPLTVDLAAAGCSVRSLLDQGRDGVMSGTSQAAPLVTFAAALLASEGLGPLEIKNRLEMSARWRPELRDKIAAGLLDVERAVSIHEDFVVLRGEGLPIAGRIDAPACVVIDGSCRSFDEVARIMDRYPLGGGEPAVAWVYSTDGLLVPTRMEIPAGTLRIREQSTGLVRAVPWADVVEVLSAIDR